jgi:glyoxylase-like metal-dependent hydrolase (beta-lactamase superfamily II)
MLHKIGIVISAIGLICCFISPIPLSSAEETQIETKQLTNEITVLMGIGGNIGVFTGDDGIFLIDTSQDAKHVEPMKAAITNISDKPIRFVLNTHWHYDHVNGNEALAKAGAVILAHKNARQRVSTVQDQTQPLPQAAWPVITFEKNLTLHINGGDVEIFYAGNAHTDGDAIAFFRKANVLHIGDIYFEGLYPWIDVPANGSIDGMIDVVTQVLPMLDEQTIVIPGHGPISDKSGLQDYLAMLIGIRDAIRPLVDAGKTLAEVQAAHPTQAFDDKWGKVWLTPDQFTELVYSGMVKQH